MQLKLEPRSTQPAPDLSPIPIRPDLSQALDPTGSGLPAIAPLILDDPRPAIVGQLFEKNPEYVSHMLRQLAGQLNDGEDITRNFFSNDDGMILNGGLITKFCVLFQGFVASDGLTTQKLGVPVFDVEVPDDWEFDLCSAKAEEEQASFAVKIMGASGGHGSKKTVRGKISLFQFVRSCQAQVSAKIQWRTYKRPKTNETLYVGNVTDVIDGMVVRCRNERTYLDVHTERYAHVVDRFGSEEGAERGEYDYEIKEMAYDAYSFEMPVPIGNFVPVSFTVTMSSKCQTSISFAARFPRGVYEVTGPTGNPVVISFRRGE